jgi:hypothetical protein
MMSRKALRMLYFLYIQSIISYRIILGGNTPKIFRMKKKVLRIMNKSKKMDLCRALFNTVEIVPLYSQYILSLIIYVVNNKHLQKVYKSITMTLDLLIIFIYPLLIYLNTKKEFIIREFKSLSIWAACFFCYTSTTCQWQSHLRQFQ